MNVTSAVIGWVKSRSRLRSDSTRVLEDASKLPRFEILTSDWWGRSNLMVKHSTSSEYLLVHLSSIFTVHPFTMALNPRFAGQKLVASASSKTLHTLEIYLDYVCPFSKKMFDTVYDKVFPIVKSKYSDKVQFIFRQQIQPWHPSSTLTHEAGAAVLQVQPDRFWDFSKALFAKQTDFFDVNVVDEPRNKTYERLAKLAGGAGVDEKKVYGLLEVPDKPDKDGSTNVGMDTSILLWFGVGHSC